MPEKFARYVRTYLLIVKPPFAVLGLVLLLCSPLHAQLNFNGGNFGTASFGQTVFSFTPSGGMPPYTFSYAPGANVIADFRVTNRPDVPNFISAGATGALIGVAGKDTCAPTGTCNTTVRMTDATNSFIDRAVSFSVTTVDIGGATFFGYGVGDFVDFRFWGVGGTPPYTFTLAAGTLPPGTQINTISSPSFTGIAVSGVVNTVGNYNFTLKVTDNGNHTFTRGFGTSVGAIRLAEDRKLPAANVGLFYSHALTATGCTGTCTFTIRAGDTLPAGISLSPAGVLSGTPPNVSFFNNFSVIISDGNNNSTTTRRLQLTVLPVTPVPLSVSTNTVTDVYPGLSLHYAIYGTGGLPPYTLSLDGSSTLPEGAFILPSSAVGPDWDPQPGYLGAKVPTTGVFDFVIRITDSANNTATRRLTWRGVTLGTWYENYTLPISPNPAAVLGVPITPQPLIAIGGTPPYSITPIDLPAGLTLDGNGIISGTPKEIGQFMPINVLIRDSANPQTTFTHSGWITVGAPAGIGLTLTGGNFGPLQKGGQSTITIFAAGSPLISPNFTVTILEGTLPPGMALLTGNNFNNAGDITRAAQISGIPTTAGTYSVLLRVQDAAGNIGQRQLKITVSNLAFVNAAIAQGTVGVPYNQTFDVRGGQSPYTFSITTGNLPTGLSLNGPTITGTPQTSNSLGVGIRVTDANGDTLVRNFALNIYELEITTPNILPTAYLGEPYPPLTFTVNPPGVYTWTAVLPLGLTLDPTTGTLSGTPLTAGTANITVTAGTSSKVVSKIFTVFAVSRSSSGLLNLLPTASLGDLVIGSSVNLTLNVGGGTPPYTVTVAPGSVLPPGLALVPANIGNAASLFGRFALYGVPTATGNYNFRLRYADAAGIIEERTVTLRVVRIGLATTALGLGIINVPYAGQLVGAGSPGPFTFALANLVNNVLPPGLTLSSSGLVSGTPTSTGAFTFTLDISDGSSTRQQAATVTINATNDLRRIDFTNTVAPVILSLGRGIGISFIPVNGAGTHTWSIASGSLPPGLQLRAGATLPSGFTEPTAFVAGVPSAAGTFKFAIRVDDSAGNFGVREFTFRITPLRVGPANIPQTLGFAPPPIKAGTPYSYNLTAFNNNGPVTFDNVVGTFMPGGVSMNSAGLIAGTANDTGNFVQAYVMTDGAGNTLQNNGSAFTVYPPGPVGVLGLTAATLANATKGTAYSKNLNDLLFEGYGTAPFTWTLLNGSLPVGVSILGNLLTGTPTETGTRVFTLIVTDANGSKHVVPNLSLAVSVMSLTPGPGTLPPAIAGIPYSQTFTAAGGVPTITYRLGFGSDLPVGLTLSSAGVLSGTPTTSGPFILLIEAVDSTGSTFLQRYRLDVAPVGTVFPALTATPSSVNLNYVLGNPSPAPIPVSIGSTSTALNFSVQTAGGSWLSVAPDSGSTLGFATLSFNIAGLVAGIYNGALNMTAASAINSPLSVPVKLTVTEPVACGFALNPSTGFIASAGGPFSFEVTTDASCNWTASTSTPWITINSPGSGTGIGSVNLSVQPNPNPATRTGTVTVQGLTFTLTQFGSACSFALTPNSITVDSYGGTGSINLEASGGECQWGTAQSIGWITADPISDKGSRTVDVNVQSTTSTRSGTITIAQQILIVNQTGVDCSFFLSKSELQFSSSGGSDSVQLTIPNPPCNWKIDTGPNWIKLLSSPSGTAGGTVSLSITPNSSTAGRSATVLIADQSLDIRQDGVSCSFSVGVDNTLFASSGGAGNIAITATPKVAGGFCPWVISSNAAWLTPSSSSGSGSQGVSFNVTANPGATGRSATLNVAGQNIVISQSGPVCEFTLRSTSASVPFSASDSSIGVITANGCRWGETSNVPFIAFTSIPPDEGGTGEVNFHVQANTTGLERVATLMVAGKPFTVTQAKAPCSAQIIPPTLVNVGAFGGTGSFAYSTSVSNCEPTVLSYSSMISVTSTSYSGTSGTVNFSVEPNGFAASRSGVIRVGDLSFTVNQAPSPCQYTLTSFDASFGRLGGDDGSIPMFFGPPACGPATAVVKGPVGMITLDEVLKDGSTYNQRFKVGIYQSFINYIRTAQIIINGQIFTVKQTSW